MKRLVGLAMLGAITASAVAVTSMNGPPVGQVGKVLTYAVVEIAEEAPSGEVVTTEQVVLPDKSLEVTAIQQKMVVMAIIERSADEASLAGVGTSNKFFDREPQSLHSTKGGDPNVVRAVLA